MEPTTASRMHCTPGERDPQSTESTAKSGGGFMKETVATMATSRAQEAMLRHQVGLQSLQQAHVI